MLAKIAAATEPHRFRQGFKEDLLNHGRNVPVRIADLIALSVETALSRISPAAVFVPTHSGATARSIARFKLPVWIVGVSSLEATCQRLLFSSGVYPMCEPDHPKDWNAYVGDWLQSHELEGDLAILTEGPSAKHPEANNRMEIIQLRCKEKKD
jgi:pyruvate kinase